MISSIRRSWELFYCDGSAVEVRIFLNKRASNGLWGNEFTDILSGFFTDLETLIRLLGAIERQAKPQATYITLNPVALAVAARALNRFKGAKKGEGAADSDIATRSWLLIDLDPIRPNKISSSEAEIRAALDRSAVIADALSKRGWPDPVIAFSGNGYHLLYRIAMRNSSTYRDLLADTLKGLQLQFSDKADKNDLGSKVLEGEIGVKLDPSVFNAGRITKLYGTYARKGDQVADRTHRQSQIVMGPERVDPVSIGLLEAEAEIYRAYKAMLDGESREKNNRGNGGESPIIGRFNREHPITIEMAAHGYKQAHDARWNHPEGDGRSVLICEDGKSLHFSTNDPMYGRRRDAFDYEVQFKFNGDQDRAITHWAGQYGVTLKNPKYRNGNGAGHSVNYEVNAPTPEHRIAQVKQPNKEARVEPGQAVSEPVIGASEIYKITFEIFIERMRLRVAEIYDKSFAIACLHDNESGNARMLHSVLKGYIVYDHIDKNWFWYNGLHWQLDNKSDMAYLASEVLKYYYDILSTRTAADHDLLVKRLAEEHDDQIAKEAKRLGKLKGDAYERSKLLCNITNVRNCLAFAVAGQRLGIAGDEWDDNIERPSDNA